MDFVTALAFAGAVFVFTFKPGPGMLTSVIRSLGDGWVQGSTIAFGHCLMHLVILTLVCFAFSFAHGHVEFLGTLLKVMGGVCMIYMGVQEFTKLDAPITANAGQSFEDFWHNFVAGVASGANPLNVFFYAGLIPTVIDMNDLNGTDIMLCNLIVFLINWGGLTLLCIMADAVRAQFARPDTMRYIRGGAAVMFILLGLIMGLSAMPMVDWGRVYYGDFAS